MRTLAHSVGWLLLGLGVALFSYDALVLIKCGFDINDVYGITNNGGPIDWPTGLRPSWTFIPAFVYALLLLLAGVLAFVPWPESLRSERSRVWRGTE